MDKNSLESRIEAATLGLEITNEQEYYTSGEAISGTVVVHLERAATTQSLTVSLGYNEKLVTSHTSSPSLYGFAACVRLISEPTTLNAGCHRFTFAVTVPDDSRDYPPSITEKWGLWSHYDISWAMTGELAATELAHRHGAAALPSIVKKHSVAVVLYPARWWLPQKAFSLDVSASKVAKVTVISPTTIPQAPKLCDIKVIIEPGLPIYVKSIEVFLERDLVVWCELYAKAHFRSLPIGRVAVEHVVVDKLELHGRALGWGLKSMQPGAFVAHHGSLCYKLCIVVHVRRRRPLTLRRTFVHVEPAKKHDDLGQGLPMYSEKEAAAEL